MERIIIKVVNKDGHYRCRSKADKAALRQLVDAMWLHYTAKWPNGELTELEFHKQTITAILGKEINNVLVLEIPAIDTDLIVANIVDGNHDGLSSVLDELGDKRIITTQDLKNI